MKTKQPMHIADQYRSLFEFAVERIEYFYQRNEDIEKLLDSIERILKMGFSFFPGVFCDFRIERFIKEVGNRIHQEEGILFSKDTKHAKRHVLHVCTAVSNVGGHTRTLLDWIHDDEDSHHSLIFTSLNRCLPSVFFKEQQSAQIKAIYLVSSSLSKQDQAIHLAKQMLRYDVVVLHHHPYDVVVPVACSIIMGKGTEIVYFNHSSHTFAAGITIADIVVNFAEKNNWQVRKYIGIQNVALLSFRDQNRKIDKLSLVYAEGVRERFGIGKQDTVLVSVGSTSKYGPIASNWLLSYLSSVCQEQENVKVVIGVSHPHVAREIEACYPWLHVIETNENLDALIELCDIYLDTMPVSGGLTAFTFASNAKPVLFGHFCELPSSMSSFDCIQDLPENLRPKNRMDYEKALMKLIHDPFARKENVASLRASIGKYGCHKHRKIQLNMIYETLLMQENRDDVCSDTSPLWDRRQRYLVGRQLARNGLMAACIREVFCCILRRRSLKDILLECSYTLKTRSMDYSMCKIILLHFCVYIKQMVMRSNHD